MRLYTKWLICSAAAIAPLFAQATGPTFTITTSSPLPNGVQGLPYSQTLSTANGAGPYTWGLSAGSLPSGLSLGQSTGTISGTPTQTGTQTFTVGVLDAQRRTASKAFTITVQALPPLAIVNSSPSPPGSVGVAYQEDYNATGGNPPYTFTLYSGQFPIGLTLASNGLLSGTPTTPGNYTFTLQATDTSPAGAAPRTVTKTFTIRITLPLTVTSPSPIQATVGVVSTTVMTATGGAPPYIWQGTGLPTWLKFDSASPDFLTGTPPAAGTFNFTVRASDTVGNTATKDLTMVVQTASALSITTATPLPNGPANVSYSVTLVAAGGVTPYTWGIDTGGLPSGLLINPTTGVISGTPTVSGTTSFIARVTDNAKVTATKAFSITITPGAAQGSPLLSTSTLEFSALVGGDTPAPQNFSLISTGQALQFTLQADGGATGTPAPGWIRGGPAKGSTPGRFGVVVNQAGLTAGKYTARIVVTTSDNRQSIVTVNLTVNPASPQLDVSPKYLRYGGTQNPSGLVEQNLLVRNIGGGGPISFTASPFQGSAWLTLNPTSGTVGPNAPVLLRVIVNTQSLPRVPSRGLIHFESNVGNVDIPVSLIVRDSSPVIDLNVNGLRFEARDGQGNANTRSVNVLNIGQGAVNWTADLLNGADWITLGNTTGSSTPGNPSPLSVSVRPGTLDTGNYYGLIRIVDPNALASPQYLPIFLVVKDEAEPATPDPSPSGLYFVAKAGGAAPPSQNVRVFTSSVTPVPFQVSGNVSDTLGAGWLSITPTSGTTSTNAVAQVAVTVNPAGLPPGLYSGDITIAFSSTVVRTTNVTLVVQPATTASAASGKSRSVAGCSPAKLSLTQTGLVNSFAAPAGWPTPLAVRLSDDCGEPVVNGQVVATFSNGDPALSMKLTVPETGIYSATWSPSRVSPTMTVTARAAAPNLQNTSADITGSVTDNKAPVLFPNRVVNNLYGLDGAPLAPGMVAQVFGSGLASSTVEPGIFPLPKTFNGTRVLVGTFEAPLYFLSDGQLNVQLPTELQSNREYSIIVATPGGITLPDTISLAQAQPGVVAFSDRRVVAQHSDATASLISPASPAKPGEVITMYLVGMGPTNPSVPSSTAAPGVEPLARVVAQPTVTIGGKEAQIIYAGLTPFAVGLYQISLFVPNDISGDLPVIITQNGVPANDTVISVR